MPSSILTTKTDQLKPIQDLFHMATYKTVALHKTELAGVGGFEGLDPGKLELLSLTAFSD